MISIIFISLSFLIRNSLQISFGSYYQDNMVLQRAPFKSVIWGYASLGSKISLTLFNKTYTTLAQQNLNYQQPIWKLILDPIYHKMPLNLEFTEQKLNKNREKGILKNILFGDVWLCSGQSNMQISLNSTINGTNEINNSDSFRNKIRIFTSKKERSHKPEFDLNITLNWSEPNKQSLGGSKWEYFSATCWYFGKGLAEKLDYPIGLIVSSQSSTEIERWTSLDTLEKCKVKNRNLNNSANFNAMIHPLFNLTIYGVVWYQGEANVNYNLEYYSCNFKEMIDFWRAKWYQSTQGSTDPVFPFGFVQIANLNPENVSIGNWPWLRWQQTAGFGYAPNKILNKVFMATAVDLVDNSNDALHPRFKKDVGQRLALAALNIAYNKNKEYSPLRVRSVTENLNQVEIKFESDYKPVELRVMNKNGFDLCCTDLKICLKQEFQNWYLNQYFEIKGDMVLINKPENCKNFSYVRYLWRQKPCEFKSCALYSKRTNLPVYPFISTNTSS